MGCKGRGRLDSEPPRSRREVGTCSGRPPRVFSVGSHSVTHGEQKQRQGTFVQAEQLGRKKGQAPGGNQGRQNYTGFSGLAAGERHLCTSRLELRTYLSGSGMN